MIASKHKNSDTGNSYAIEKLSNAHYVLSEGP